MSIRIILDLAYVGTNYCGFQAQPSGDSVQQTVQNCAVKCFNSECTVTGCSRTDAGVHANSYIALLTLGDGANRIPYDRIPQAMARFLPYDIAVKSAIPAPDDFHPRYSAHAKEYVYLIHNSQTRDPFMHLRAHHVPHRLDADLMNEAARLMTGRRDWRTFMASGSDIVDTVRDVKYFMCERNGELVRITVAADGFLYNMVRIMSGTLVAVSEGRIKLGDIESIIASGDRKRAGVTLPAHGLYLNKVMYDGIN